MTGPHPTAANTKGTKDAEWTYSLMNHISTSLGVSCTYCHNTRAFGDWTESTPKRTRAWYGIRMVRMMNQKFLEPLRTVFPDARLGPEGDAPKAYCSTCHYNIPKPLYGADMISKYPSLAKPGPQPWPPLETTTPMQ